MEQMEQTLKKDQTHQKVANAPNGAYVHLHTYKLTKSWANTHVEQIKLEVERSPIKQPWKRTLKVCKNEHYKCSKEAILIVNGGQ